MRELVAGVLVVALLAGCGGSDDGKRSAGSTESDGGISQCIQSWNAESNLDARTTLAALQWAGGGANQVLDAVVLVADQDDPNSKGSVASGPEVPGVRRGDCVIGLDLGRGDLGMYAVRHDGRWSAGNSHALGNVIGAEPGTEPIFARLMGDPSNAVAVVPPLVPVGDDTPGILIRAGDDTG